jgi:hypothetical protein
MSINGTKVVLSGRGLARHHYDQRQVACLAANVHVALAPFKPSISWLSRLFGVSGPYIAAALKLPAERRAAIVEGRDGTSFTNLLKAPERQLALPMPAEINDAEVVKFVRTIGRTRVLDAAVAIEAAQ